MFVNIQLLRAYAAIIVVFHHIAPQYEAMGGNIKYFGRIADWGFAGVDIFFVISGFIMAHTTFHKERTWNNAKNFLKNRLSRIYLGYWPFFVAFVLSVGTFSPNRFLEIDMLGSFFLTNVDMFRLLMPISWTLSFEIYFYFLFSLLFALPVKLAKIAIHVVLAALLLRITLIFIDSGPLYFFLSHFLVEFFAGAALYIYHKKLKKIWMAIVFIVIMILAYKHGIDVNARNNAYRVYTFGLGALCLLALALTLEQCKVYRAGKLSIAIGDASYTIYLSHLLFISLFYYSGLRNFLANQNTFIGNIGFFSYISAIIAISVVIYRKFELPIYRLATRPTHAPA